MTMDKDTKWKSLNLGQVSKWDNIQSDRFTLWANHYLQKKGLAIKDLSDFSDGVLLLNLLEVVSGKNVPRYIKNPRFLHHKIENITIALNFIEKVLDIKVLGCNAKDIADGNLKQILGIIFMLIQKSKESEAEGGEESKSPRKSALARTPSQSQLGKQPSTLARKPEVAHAEAPHAEASNGTTSTSTSATAAPETQATVTPVAAAATPADSPASTPEPIPVSPSTAIPITKETAPFTPKVHRPRIGTQEMLHARGVAKGSFIAKQEFFANKEQEHRDKQQSLNVRPPLTSPTREFGVPIMLFNTRKEGSSSTVVSPREEEIIEPAVQVVPVVPAVQATIPREKAAPGKGLLGEHRTEAAVIAAQSATQDTSSSASTTPASTPRELTPREPEAAKPDDKVEPEPEPESPEKPATGETTPSESTSEAETYEPPTPEQQRKLEAQKKKELKKEKKRLSDIKKKKRRSGTEGDLVESDKEDEGKKEETIPEEKFEDLNVPEDAVVMLQTRIRASMSRLGYLKALQDIEKRKAELLADISSNEKAMKGTLRVQAVLRGRLTRIRVRREAQIYRRNEIAKEILTTERKYIQNLDVLVTQFLEPMKKMLTPQQLRSIFSNVEVIRGYNKTLLTRLEERMTVWYSKGQCLGDIFVEITEFLKIYTTYVNNYNTSIATMTECMENTKFAAFIEKMRGAAECNGLSFASFLIQPIQRLPRYVLLLQDLVKHTPPKHADYAQLSKALKKMKDVADYVNERKREAENLTQVLAIQSKLTGKFENLAEPHRRYVRRGSLAMFDEKANIKSFFFFLFNDVLVYTENKAQSRLFRGSFGRQSQLNWDEQAFNQGKFKYMGRLPLQGLGAGVADVPDTEKDKVSFAFQLITPTTSTLLMANSQDEKVAWMNDLDECVYALLEKERSRKTSQLTDDPQSSWHTKVTVSTAPEDGDYTGYIYKKANNNAWNQRYFLLRNGLLYYFPDKPPADAKEHPARAISLVWCSVKVGQVLDRGAVFQLATPARIIFLSSPDPRTMFQWIYVLRLSIAAQIQSLLEEDETPVSETPSISDKFEPILEPPNSPPLFSSTSTLSSSPGSASSLSSSVERERSNTPTSQSMQEFQELLQQPDNRVCADCGAPSPSWISTSLGVLLCVSCSGIHRRLPSGATGLQSVRSLSSRPESIDIKSLGNALANAKYEKNVSSDMKPTQNDPYDKKVEWIKAKYSSNDNHEPSSISTPPLSRSSSRSPAADALVQSISNPALSFLMSSSSVSPTNSAAAAIQKAPERRNSNLGLDKALNKTKDGQLYKRQGALLQDDWKLYRFVLKEDHISYFKGKQPKGTIDLMLCSVKEGEVFASGTDRPKYSFEIVAPTRIYMLAAESTQARDEWVHAINVCIATMMK